MSQVPISTLPDEMLAMIFEAGTLFEDPQCHFGTLVSHVARRWRQIALSIPQLWNEISYDIRPGEPEIPPKTSAHPDRQVERAISFLSRCRTFPIDVSMALEGHTIPQDFFKSIVDHMGHCRQLCIKEANAGALERIIQYLSTKSAPLLCSIHFDAFQYTNGGFHGEVKFLAPLFPSGAPQLRTVQLGWFHMPTLHFCIPVLRSVTSLRLTNFEVQTFYQTSYESFRDALMALPFLNHLELLPRLFFCYHQHRLPIVLPTIQFLHLATRNSQRLDDIIHSFQAASLITLSLEGPWRNANIEGTSMFEQRFPSLETLTSLEHLILLNITKEYPDLSEVIARKFPGIKRLTCQVAPRALGCDITHILRSMCFGAQHDEETESPPANGLWDRWLELRVIAVSATDIPLNTAVLCNMISMLEYGGCGIRKLLLPNALFAHADVDGIGKLREVVEVEDYSLDWPMPFARCS